MLRSMASLMPPRDPAGSEMMLGPGPAALLDAIHALVLVLDAQGYILYLNRHGEGLLGYSHHEVHGLRLEELAALAPGQGTEGAALVRLVEGPHPAQHEGPWRTRAGSERLLAWSTSRLAPGLFGAEDLLVLTGVEMTEYDRALREQVRFFQTLIDSIPNPIFYKTLDGRYGGCNRAFAEMHNKSPEDIIGKSVWEMAPPELAARYAAKDQELFDRPGIQTYESSVRFGTGEVRDVIFYKATYTDAQGKPAGLVGIVLDITDRKRAEAALQKARDELEERVRERTAELQKLKDAAEAADRTKTEFLNIASHELRTPLTSLHLVLTQARRQLERNEPVSDVTLVSRMERYTGRLTRLAGDLLDASRLERGQLHMRPRPVDLRSLVADVAGDFRQQYPERQVEVELPEGVAWVGADRDRIEQVLANFLDNAMKYTPPKARVAVQLSCWDGTFRVSVSDEGPGIPAEEHARLFQRFHRLSSSIHQPGLGLGLYISREIIERHGGRLGVLGHPPGRPGVTFFFELPRSR
ncbi:PAS domain-containing protein [Archangium violaceum]|uniref:sensor histidine kinase n=1 Tax=Archangium violaceum TaxID=83451 RepID=UPI002B2BF96E|nr:PAS domain-containing protein [Archangium violaceum]